MDTLQTWITRAYAVRCTPEQREGIAALCLAAQERGDAVNSVWHQSAQYFGYPERCNCGHCKRFNGVEGMVADARRFGGGSK